MSTASKLPPPNYRDAARASRWTCREGIAYTLGINPPLVAVEKLHTLPRELQAEFERRHRLALEAVKSGALTATNLTLPLGDELDAEPEIDAAQFIAWARANYPPNPELDSALDAHAPETIDWKKRCETERAKCAGLELRISNQSGTAKELNTARRMLLGMAMARWNYKCDADRQTATGKNEGSILVDLQRVLKAGAPKDETIRSHLSAACADLDAELRK